jgi:hypothetical protein
MYLLTLEFVEAKSDTSLFVFCHDTNTIYLLLYVDDIVLTASSTTLLQYTIFVLKREFVMKYLDLLHHFLGISVQHQVDGLFLTQRQSALDVLEHAGMVDYKLVSTPVDTQAKVSATSGPHAGNLTSVRPPLSIDPSSIVVGNRSSLPVTSVGNTAFPGLFYLNNVLVTPDII